MTFIVVAADGVTKVKGEVLSDNGALVVVRPLDMGTDLLINRAAIFDAYVEDES